MSPQIQNFYFSPESIMSLHLTLVFGIVEMGTATGFVVVHNGKPFLVTNWHVVSGRRPDTGQPTDIHGMVPDRINIRHFVGGLPTKLEWRTFEEKTTDGEGNPRWLEHPVHGRAVDVVALPLTNLRQVELRPYDLAQPDTELAVSASDWVDVIGFPFGYAGGASFGIWTKAGVASEIDFPYNNFPCFLVDARTRPGQSGSPVVAYALPGQARTRDSAVVVQPSAVCNLLGVYSGRLNAESDLGIVWKKSAILEILEGGVQGSVALQPSSDENA